MTFPNETFSRKDVDVCFHVFRTLFEKDFDFYEDDDEACYAHHETFHLCPGVRGDAHFRKEEKHVPFARKFIRFLLGCSDMIVIVKDGEIPILQLIRQTELFNVFKSFTQLIVGLEDILNALRCKFPRDIAIMILRFSTIGPKY